MRNVLMSVGAMAVLATIAAQAQTPQTQPDPKQIVTVTGCVTKESDVLKRPAVTGQVGMGDEFVLTKSTIQTSPASAQPSKPDEPSAAPGKVYRLTGDQEASLVSHLGHKVEITGTFKSASDATRELGAIGTSGRPPATPSEPTATNTPEITINSVKMISETCGG